MPWEIPRHQRMNSSVRTAKIPSTETDTERTPNRSRKNCKRTHRHPNKSTTNPRECGNAPNCSRKSHDWYKMHIKLINNWSQRLRKNYPTKTENPPTETVIENTPYKSTTKPRECGNAPNCSRKSPETADWYRMHIKLINNWRLRKNPPTITENPPTETVIENTPNKSTDNPRECGNAHNCSRKSHDWYRMHIKIWSQ